MRFRYFKFELTIEFFSHAQFIWMMMNTTLIYFWEKFSLFNFKYLWKLLSTAVSMKVDCRQNQNFLWKIYLLPIHLVSFTRLNFLLLLSSWWSATNISAHSNESIKVFFYNAISRLRFAWWHFGIKLILLNYFVPFPWN